MITFMTLLCRKEMADVSNILKNFDIKMEESYIKTQSTIKSKIEEKNKYNNKEASSKLSKFTNLLNGKILFNNIIQTDFVSSIINTLEMPACIYSQDYHPIIYNKEFGRFLDHYSGSLPLNYNIKKELLDLYNAAPLDQNNPTKIDNKHLFYEKLIIQKNKDRFFIKTSILKDTTNNNFYYFSIITNIKG